MKQKILFISIFLLGFQLFSQTKEILDDVLFTVEEEAVLASEFIRVYKKNLDLVKDDNQKDIDAYFELFVNYKLKLKEAKTLEFDKKPKYLREFESYKKQLAKNYLTDHNVTENLVREAYDRMNFDVNVSHILIQIPEQEKDTLAVFNRMLEIKEKFQKQNILEVKNSLKDNSQVIAEDLGYFSAFKMVYAFESVAFNTPVGQVSNPFRTQFGYHVLKVHDKRKSRGEVTVGHIMITDKQNDSLSNPAERIKEIYKLIQQGQPFETLATQFSEDQSSAKNGGKLRPFKSGQLSSVEFENIAFGLTEIGQISKPFKTNYGWHIAKLYDIKNIESFEQLKPNLEQRVQRDARSKMITKSFVTKLREKYSVNEDIDLSYFESIIDSTYNTNSWKSPSESNLDESLFNIGSKQLTFNDFLIYLQRNQKRIRTKMSNQDIIQTQFNALVQEELLKHHEANLELENEEYANVLAEYRDGLLLFDLMEVTIWKAVQADTLALKKYYEENKSKYIWPARIDAVVATSSDPKFASMAKSGFESNTDLEQLKSDINLDKKQNVIFRTGKFEANHRALPEGFVFKEGVSQIYNDKSAYYVVKVNELLSESTKSFTEAKGNVISEYQGQFEAEWLQSLKNKYKVTVNQEVFNNVKAQISQ